MRISHKLKPRYAPVFLLLLIALAGCSRRADETISPQELTGAPTFTVDASSLPKTLKIIAYGDVRFTDPSEKRQSHPRARQALVARIAQEKPDALLVTGDLPYRGARTDDWAVVHRETQAWRDAKLRVYPALGNHELRGGTPEGLQNWWAEFPQLTGRRWYSVQFGNCYFITLDSDTKMAPESAQGRWLASQLAHIPPSIDFVLLLMHHPAYTDSEDLSGHSAEMQEKKLGRRLEELQPNLHARMIAIAGHVHNYERFSHNGVTYLVTGGGGASPYLFRRSKDDFYPGGRETNFHYLTFTINGGQLKMVMTKLMNPDSDGPPQWEDKDSLQLSVAGK